MCWSRLSFLLRPPWTPERPRYPIRLKVRLMGCPGRGEKRDPSAPRLAVSGSYASHAEVGATVCSLLVSSHPRTGQTLVPRCHNFQQSPTLESDYFAATNEALGTRGPGAEPHNILC